MPFTVSHVAAVLPGYRPLSRAQVFSAAVIGSMVPDFGLLLPGALARWQTHSLYALITFCLPVGLITYVLTQWLIKPAVTAVAPPAAYARLSAAHPVAPLTDLKHWSHVIGALLLGALTHLVWDGFTHEDGRGARMFPLLSDYGPEMAGHPLQFYRFAQYASSVVGLVIVLVALVLWLRHAQRLYAPATIPAAAAAQRLRRTERNLWIALYMTPPLAMLAPHVVFPLIRGISISNGGVISGVAIAWMHGTALSLLLVSAAIRVRLQCR